jgi:hypothetical protein
MVACLGLALLFSVSRAASDSRKLLQYGFNPLDSLLNPKRKKDPSSPIYITPFDREVSYRVGGCRKASPIERTLASFPSVVLPSTPSPTLMTPGEYHLCFIYSLCRPRSSAKPRCRRHSPISCRHIPTPSSPGRGVSTIHSLHPYPHQSWQPHPQRPKPHIWPTFLPPQVKYMMHFLNSLCLHHAMPIQQLETHTEYTSPKKTSM